MDTVGLVYLTACRKGLEIQTLESLLRVWLVTQADRKCCAE